MRAWSLLKISSSTPATKHSGTYHHFKLECKWIDVEKIYEEEVLLHTSERAESPVDSFEYPYHSRKLSFPPIGWENFLVRTLLCKEGLQNFPGVLFTETKVVMLVFDKYLWRVIWSARAREIFKRRYTYASTK